MDELERHRRALAVARELPGDHATPAHVKRQAVAIVAAIDRCASVGELAQWLLDTHPELADVLPLSSVQRIFLAGRGPPDRPPAITTAHLTPTLSFNALCRARTTLDDFSHFYLGYHGLPLEAFFRWMPLLVFVECSIYQLDEDNEALASACVVDRPAAGHGGGATEQTLLAVLASRGLLDEHVREQLAAGHRYWTLERKICAQMGMAAGGEGRAAASHPAPSAPTTAAPSLPQPTAAAAAATGAGASSSSSDSDSTSKDKDERTQAAAAAGGGAGGGEAGGEAGREAGGAFLREVLEAHGLKSFDYRLLHALLCQLSGRPLTAELRAFLTVDETLVDLADDLFDYEKDVLKNSFNVLRGHVHALGKVDAPLALVTRIGQLESEHERLLRRLPPEVQASYAAQRSRAMAEPGSEKWRFPPRLMSAEEEAAFRLEHADDDEEEAEEEEGAGERGGGEPPRLGRKVGAHLPTGGLKRRRD